MKYSTDFKMLSEKINFINVIKYLKDLGWLEFKTSKSSVKILQKEIDNDFFQVNIPIEKSLKDYKQAMYLVVETISNAYNKNIEQVMLELLNPSSDILRIRVDSPDTNTGSICIKDAIYLYSNTKKLLISTAMDLVKPGLIYKGNPTKNINDFISNCKVGQTEVGSYLVSLICPHDDIAIGPKQLTILDEKKDSLTRRVINKLIKSISDVKQNIENATFEDHMINSIESDNPISINFLEALSNIGIYNKNTSLEISVKYYPTSNYKKLDTPHIKITSDYYSEIESFIKRIKKETAPTKEYIGRIKSLESNSNTEVRKEGTVKLEFLDDDSTIKIYNVTLPIEDYENAIEAHKLGKHVKVIGERKDTKIIHEQFSIIS